MQRQLDPDHLKESEDWEGNNIAFACPNCKKIYIVSEQIHRGRRSCPKCGKSTGNISGGRKSGGTALIVWD